MGIKQDIIEAAEDMLNAAAETLNDYNTPKYQARYDYSKAQYDRLMEYAAKLEE